MKVKPASKRKTNGAVEEQPVLEPMGSIPPPFKQPPLRSTVAGHVAMRISGLTYSIPADQAEAFLARYKPQ